MSSSLFVWGAWIEIPPKSSLRGHTRRSSYEERGLKSTKRAVVFSISVALRMRSVDWNTLLSKKRSCQLSLFVWGAWIEIISFIFKMEYLRSLFVWGAWIEIILAVRNELIGCRSSYEERGLKYVASNANKLIVVALRMRSVDWNATDTYLIPYDLSLFVWGAWIEIEDVYQKE